MIAAEGDAGPSAGNAGVIGVNIHRIHGEARFGSVSGDVHVHEARRCTECLPPPFEPPAAGLLAGRDTLIAEVAARLAAPEGPAVVSLCGMGGVGKSALAAAVAGHATVRDRFADGIFWFHLPESDPLASLDRIACTFARDVSGIASLSERRAAARDALHGRHVLLVLDDAWTLEQAEALLLETEHARALLTTRDIALAAALHADLVQVPTLPIESSLEVLRGYGGDAIVVDHLASCTALVALAEGLPLALEMAAQRMRADSAVDPDFSVAALVEELRETGRTLALGPRSRPVRMVFESSWARSLDVDGRNLFRLLGIFPPEDLPVGAIAAAATLDESAARRGMRELTRLSLVKAIGGGAYRLHPLLREFAVEKLAELPSIERQAAHARASDYFAAVAEQMLAASAPHSIDDLRPALRAHWHAWSAGDAKRAERVFPWIGNLAVAAALRGLGFLPTLLELHRQKLDLLRPQGPRLESWGLYWLGNAELDAGLLSDGIAHIEQALQIADERDPAGEDDPFILGRCTYRLGQAYLQIGDPDRATLHLQRALALDTDVFKSPSHVALTILALGDAERDRSDVDGTDKALLRYQEAIAVARSNGCEREEAIAELRRAALCYSANDHPACANALERAGALLLDGGIADGGGDASPFARLARAAGDLAMNGEAYAGFVNIAARAFAVSLRNSRAAGDRVAESRELYAFANFCEHLFLVPGHDTDFPGAVAGYLLAERRTEEMELPPNLNARTRLETRILPRLGADRYAELEARSAVEAEEMIREAVARLTDSTPLHTASEQPSLAENGEPD